MKYSENHIWVEPCEDGSVLLGVSDHAVNETGEIVYVDLGNSHRVVKSGQEMGSFESNKAVPFLIAPFDLEILEVNKGVEDSPDELNKGAEGPEETWLYKAKPLSQDWDARLMEASEYWHFIQKGNSK